MPKLALLLLACSLVPSGGLAMLPAVGLQPRHALAARRCPAPLAMADDSADENAEQWSTVDDQMLAEHVSLRGRVCRCGAPESVLSNIDAAWVLIFNLGQQDEGVYTLQGRHAQPSAYVLAFEHSDDAERFAELLSADEFDLATPLRWDAAQCVPARPSRASKGPAAALN